MIQTQEFNNIISILFVAWYIHVCICTCKIQYYSKSFKLLLHSYQLFPILVYECNDNILLPHRHAIIFSGSGALDILKSSLNTGYDFSTTNLI